MWNYVKTGAVSNKISVEEIENVELTIFEGGTYTLPATVKVSYNKGVVDESVIWDESDVASINPSKTGTYVVNGKVTFSKTVDDGEYAGMAEAPVTYQITVKPQNLITDAQDAGFEKGDNFTVGEAASLRSRQRMTLMQELAVCTGIMPQHRREPLPIIR